MTTSYQISFINKAGTSLLYTLESRADFRTFVDFSSSCVIGKIVDNIIVYFNFYENGRRVKKLNVNIPLIK